MNPKVYPVLLSFLLFPFSSLLSQVCAGFTVTCTTAESRCAATGSITINAAGGSGNYSYKVSGPVNTGLTSSSTITGLPAGTYSVYVKDMVSGCIVNVDNVAVAGTYSDPRYDLVKTDETCSGAGDGTISVANLQYGRSPFTYTIVAPSPAGVGTSTITGSFTGLIPGDYYIRLTDSCGGIQTRTITILANNWLITNTTVSKITCNQVSVLVELADNKGNTNAGGTAFSAFMYGAVNSPGDTSWFSSRSFNYTQSPLRSITFVVKDGCGAVKSFSWTNTKPSLNNSATTYNLDCNTFSAKVTGASNFTSPQYTLKQGTVSIQSNSTGIFGNIPYGSYCIEAYDACYDTTITRCFSASAPVPSVSGTVSISNRQCSTFTAAITGQSNLFSPQYCLYDNSNTLISCNTNGIFTGISYGSYCIKITSSAPCYDTVITRCFSAAALPPALAATVSISNQTCSSFDVTAGGQSNIFSPQFCLYDNSNVLITCNTSGVF